MKRYQIVLFLFGVSAALFLLSAFFPENNSLGLRFQNLGELLSPSEQNHEPSPEELFEQRRQAVLAAERDSFLAFFTDDPSRFPFLMMISALPVLSGNVFRKGSAAVARG